MYIKYLFFISLLFLISCSANKPSNKLKSSSTGIYKLSSINDAKVTLDQYSTNNIMLYLDTKNPEIYEDKILEVKSIFESFGNSLGKFGILLDITTGNLQDYSSRRRLFDKIQSVTKDSYEYNESPFLIFMKKENNNYMPYKILSFNNIPTNCIDYNLTIIERAITTNNNKTAHNSLSQLQMLSCSLASESEVKLGFNFNEIIKLILTTIKNI